MISLTYGVLPGKQAFLDAFARKCPDGYRIRAGAGCLFDGDWFLSEDERRTYDAEELWDLLSFLVQSNLDDRHQEASDLLYSLGFEWV